MEGEGETVGVAETDAVGVVVPAGVTGASSLREGLALLLVVGVGEAGVEIQVKPFTCGWSALQRMQVW